MQTTASPSPGAAPFDEPSFDCVVPVDVSQRMADQAEAISAFHEKLDRKKTIAMLIGIAPVIAWSWVKLYGGPSLVSWLLLVSFFVALVAVINFDRNGPGAAYMDDVIPETQLLAILTNGLPEHLSTELVIACRRLASAQAGRLLRSQFQTLKAIDSARRLRAALAGGAAHHSKSGAESLLQT